MVSLPLLTARCCWLLGPICGSNNWWISHQSLSRFNVFWIPFLFLHYLSHAIPPLLYSSHAQWSQKSLDCINAILKLEAHVVIRPIPLFAIPITILKEEDKRWVSYWLLDCSAIYYYCWLSLCIQWLFFRSKLVYFLYICQAQFQPKPKFSALECGDHNAISFILWNNCLLSSWATPGR